MKPGKTFTSPEELAEEVEQARELPSAGKLAGNFVKAVVRHVADGMRKVGVEEYQRRLDVCNECPLRLKNRCTHESCGCFIDKKAWWASEECPLGKWEDA